MDVRILVPVAIFVLCDVFHAVLGDMFTSTHNLKTLAQHELDNIPKLQKWAQKRREDLLRLKRALEEMKLKDEAMRARPNMTSQLAVAGHPLDAFNLVRRWTDISEVLSDRKTNQIQDHQDNECLDQHESCSFWADTGECDKNPGYMHYSCREACKLCLRVNYTDVSMLFKYAPTESDFRGSAAGIVRLQRHYDLDQETLAAGSVYKYRSQHGLDLDDYTEMARGAISNAEWTLAEKWLERPLDELQPGPQRMECIMTLAEIYNRTHVYSKALDLLDSELKETDKCADSSPHCMDWVIQGDCDKNKDFMSESCPLACGFCNPSREDKKLLELMNHLREIRTNMVREGFSEETSPEERFEERGKVQHFTQAQELLCQGKQTAELPPGSCSYRRSRFAPILQYKEEIILTEPRIAFLHDVITDKQAEGVKARARSQLSRAMVGVERAVSEVRVSKLHWLDDTDPFIDNLSAKVEHITGLRTRGKSYPPIAHEWPYIPSEYFQVVNYGIGGHYESHTDFFESDDVRRSLDAELGNLIHSSGDRIATILFYLTEVQAGGGTVFPTVGVHVPPVKNGAAFWFNSKLSGWYDPKTLHAGCPVLLGEKWVTNKWIREYGNEFKRRCGLTEDAVSDDGL